MAFEEHDALPFHLWIHCIYNIRIGWYHCWQTFPGLPEGVPNLLQARHRAPLVALPARRKVECDKSARLLFTHGIQISMLHRTLPLLLSKRIVLPQLSPTHTAARIIRFEVANNEQVSDYDPVMIVECSSDLVTEAFRESPDEKVKMMIDTQDEGTVKNLLQDYEGKFLDVGTELGVIDDGEPVDGDWTWQAYLHTDDNDD